jgi:hypothetical protein
MSPIENGNSAEQMQEMQQDVTAAAAEMNTDKGAERFQIAFADLNPGDNLKSRPSFPVNSHEEVTARIPPQIKPQDLAARPSFQTQEFTARPSYEGKPAVTVGGDELRPKDDFGARNEYSAESYQGKMESQVSKLLKGYGIEGAKVFYESGGKAAQVMRVELADGRTEKIHLPAVIMGPDVVANAVNAFANRVLHAPAQQQASPESSSLDSRINALAQNPDKLALFESPATKADFDSIVKNWMNISDAAVTQMKGMIRDYAASHGHNLPQNFQVNAAIKDGKPTLTIMDVAINGGRYNLPITHGPKS